MVTVIYPEQILGIGNIAFAFGQIQRYRGSKAKMLLDQDKVIYVEIGNVWETKADQECIPKI